MQLLVDENLPRSVAKFLREKSHTVLHITDSSMRGLPDTEVASFAKQNKFTILTADKGFSDIRTYIPEQYSGIIVLRLKDDFDSQHILQLVQSINFSVLGDIAGKLVIVDEMQIRIRGSI